MRHRLGPSLLHQRFPPSAFSSNEHGRAGTIGTLVGAVVGGVIGSFIPIVGTFLGASIGATLGGLAGSLYETANLDDTVTRQQTIADLRIQTSTLGQAIPQLFGEGRLAGNVIWATEKVVHEMRESQSAGGKGGGPEQVSITKTYTISMAIGLCDTRVTGEIFPLIIRAWKNATEIPIPDNWALYPGSATQLPDPTMEAALGVGNVPGYRFLCHVVMTDEDLGPSGQVAQYSFQLVQAAVIIDPRSTITRLCAAAGISGDTLDVSGVPTTGEVKMLLVSIEAIRASLEQIVLTKRLYGLESGTQYAFRQVGTGAVVATIPEDHLSAGENQPDDRGAQVGRVATLELPTIFYVTYGDKNQNFQRNTQPSTVVLPPSGRENPKNLTVTLTIEPAEARQLANELLVQAWVQREGFQATLPRRYAYLDPGDHIEVSSGGLTYPVLLSEVTYGDPGLVEIVGRVNGSPRLGSVEPGDIMPIDTAITGAETAAPGIVVPMPQSTDPPEDTTPVLLNLPVLNSSDQNPRYHVAYVGDHEPWEGGVLFRSVDGEATYQQVDFGVLEAFTGVVAIALPSVDWLSIDDTTTFTVILEYGTLTTINDDALLAGLQRAMVGDEMVYIGVADLVGVRTYDCSHLWRGRQGTDWSVGLHNADEPFILIDNAVHAVSMSTAERGIERSYKSVTRGQAIADAATVLFIPTAENLTPWRVFPPLASRPVQDWQIRWYTRSRFADSGFDPDFVGFQLTIFDDGTFTTPVRTLMTSGGHAMDPTALKGMNYTAAQQVADFGSVQGTLYYTVGQVGAYATSRVQNMTSTDVVTVQGAIEDTTIMPSITWVHVTGTTQAMAVNTGYLVDNSSLVTLTLPVTAAFGDPIIIIGRGAGGWRIAQNASQQIRFGVMQSTVGTSGYAQSGNRDDALTLICSEANTLWTPDGFQGTVTLH